MKNKKTSFRSFLKTSIISLLFLVILMFVFLFCSLKATVNNNSVLEDSVDMVFAFNSFQKGSDELTKKTRFFILTKDIRYAEKYIEEAYEKQSRENALLILNSEKYNINYDELLKIKQLSDNLQAKELRLIRLVYESEGFTDIPEQIMQVELSEEELALSPEEQYNIAKDYITIGEYGAFKDEIDLRLNLFNESLNDSAHTNVDEKNLMEFRFFLCKMGLFFLAIVWCIIILLVLSKHILKPIGSYINVYENFKKTSNNLSLVTPKGMKEIYQLGEAYNKAMVDLNELKCIVEEKNVELEIQKNLDPLTRVYNRGIFDTEKWENIEKSDYTLFCVDINKFKQINDTYGHIIGDRILGFVAKNLQSLIRKDDMIIRTGGDEFVIVVENTVEDEIINQIDNSLNELKGKVFTMDEIEIPVHFETGFAKHKKGDHSFEDVLNSADKIMYLHKKH